MPEIHVRLFAGLHDLVGKRDLVLDMPAGATVGQLRDRLGIEYPAVQAMLSTLVCAVDEEYVPSDHVLREGDDVALIPPISGGAPERRS
jgi:molybdopterin synthase catalytic subunit